MTYACVKGSSACENRKKGGTAFKTSFCEGVFFYGGGNYELF